MIKIAAAFAASLALCGFAQAVEMHPMQATSLSLGSVTGVAYYSVAGDAFQVVATLASSEEGTPMRFVATLNDGQKMLVSVPQDVGEAAIELEFARVGDSLSVTETATITAMRN
jgi:hypothetical protein